MRLPEARGAQATARTKVPGMVLRRARLLLATAAQASSGRRAAHAATSLGEALAHGSGSSAARALALVRSADLQVRALQEAGCSRRQKALHAAPRA